MTYQSTELNNGMQIASEVLAGVETVSVAVSVGVGARYEDESEGGVSHLLEHMAFKGTHKRNARELAEIFDDVGGIFNAYTSLESTVYYAKVMKRDMGLAVDVLSDILQHSVFDEDELAREREVILQEIAMHQDSPDDLVLDYFHEAAFPGQPVGRSILGTRQRIASYRKREVQGYMAKHYLPSRMVVSAAGKLNHDELHKLSAELFTSQPQGAIFTAAPGHYKGGDHRVERPLEQLHFMLGLQGVSYHDPDYYALQVLAVILGGGMSSRLFQELREKRGLVYSVSAFTSSYADCGLLGIYAACSESKAGELVPVLCEEILSMLKGVSEIELARGRNQQVAGILMSRERTSSVAEWIGRNILTYGRYKTAEEVIAAIEAVGREDIVRVAKRILSKNPITTAALGRMGELEPYEKTAERLIG